METRDPATDSRFIGLLMSEAGLTGEEASSVIRVVRNNDFLIKEVKADPESPKYGSYESILLHEQDFRKMLTILDETGRDLVREINEARHDMQPVLLAIAQAMEVKNGSSDPLPAGDA